MLGDELALFALERSLGAGVDGNVGPAGGGTQRAAQGGALRRLAGDGGDAEQLALRLGEEVGEGHGVVDVGADVGVEEEFGHGGDRG